MPALLETFTEKLDDADGEGEGEGETDGDSEADGEGEGTRLGEVLTPGVVDAAGVDVV